MAFVASFVCDRLLLSSLPAKKAGEYGELMDDETDGGRCRRPSEKASTTAATPVTKAIKPPADTPAMMPASSLDKDALLSIGWKGDASGGVAGGAQGESGGDEAS